MRPRSQGPLGPNDHNCGMNHGVRIAAIVVVPMLALSSGCSKQPSNNSKASTAQTDKASAAGRERTDGPKQLSVEELIANLQDADEEGNASDALLSVGDPAIAPLIEVLKTAPSRYGRLAAARTLAEFDDPRADAALDDALKTPDDEMTAAAYRFLLRKGRPGTERALMGALNAYGKLPMAEDFAASGNPVLKTAAERWALKSGRPLGLGSSRRKVVLWGGNVSTATPLLPLHFDNSLDSSSGVKPPDGKAPPKEQTVEDLIARLQDAEEATRASNALIAMGAPAIAPLIEVLKTAPSRYGRLAAARTLAEFDDTSADAALDEALKTPDDEMTAAAYRFLLRKGRPGTERALIGALNAYGRLDMAEDFVASGNPVLKMAAEYWASQHGFLLRGRSSTQEAVRWGGVSTATRLALFHFDNSLDSSSGLKPSESKGVSFVPGKWGSAVFIGAGGILKYPSAGNLDFNDGTIEMWISPRLDGNDPVYKQRNHPLLYVSSTGKEFQVSEGAFGGFYGGTARGKEFKGTGAGDFSKWKAGEWHYIAFTYSSRPPRVRFYIDGGLISETGSSLLALGLEGSGFMIVPFNSQFAVDELQISKGEKTKSEIGSSAFRQSPFPGR
jgi:HEAT repeat protein